MEEDFDDATMDACLIAAGQRAEHYEMAAYGTLVAWARAMGHTEAADLLQETLDEEKAADEKLTSLAEGGINQEAADASALQRRRQRRVRADEATKSAGREETGADVGSLSRSLAVRGQAHFPNPISSLIDNRWRDERGLAASGCNPLKTLLWGVHPAGTCRCEGSRCSGTDVGQLAAP